MSETVELEAPSRGRVPRIEANAAHRRRRKAGTLNRMAQFKLDCIDPESLDLEHYIYYWINDENGNLRRATKQDDYDHVTAAELGENFDPDTTDSESEGRVRMIVGTQKSGAATYAYLCKKPRAFWEEDNEAMVRAREDMMAGRVYRAEAIGDPEGKESRPGEADNFFATPDSTIGHAARRRSGPVPKHMK